MHRVQTNITEKIQDELRNGVCDFYDQMHEIYEVIHDIKSRKYESRIATVSNHFMHVCI